MDNTIPCIIKHNLPYTTTVNSIVMMEEFNKIFNREKGGVHKMIHSGIPTPEKQKTPIITLYNDLIQERNAQLIHLHFSL